MLFEQILATVRSRSSVVLKLLWKQIATKNQFGRLAAQGHTYARRLAVCDVSCLVELICEVVFSFHTKISGTLMNNLQKKSITMSPQLKLRARKALADLDDMRLKQLLETARRVERYAVGRSEQSVADALGKPLVFVNVMIAFCKTAGLLETKRARAKFLKMYGKKKVRVLYKALEASR